ncbi:hypothetical protein HDV05_006672, partial [Chytridiales sp. JEL 0842]
MGRGSNKNRYKANDPSLAAVEALMETMADQLNTADIPPHLYNKLKREKVDPSQVKPQTFLPGDGDQTPLKGLDAQNLREQWTTGMDFNPMRLNPLQAMFFTGDLDSIKNLAANKIEFASMLKTIPRFSKMNFHPIHLLVQGARMLAGDPRSFVECLKVVLECGGKDMLEARDAGIEVNRQNRFGCCAMHECVMQGKPQPIELLLRWKADVDICDYDGISSFQCAENRPTILRLIELKRREAAATVEVLLKACSNNTDTDICGNEGTKYCTRCLRARYCSVECQKNHWKSHKAQCSEALLADVKVTNFSDDFAPEDAIFMSRVNYEKDDTVVVGSVRSIKIQVPDLSGEPLMVYDRKRSFQRFIHNTDPSYNKIVHMIKTQGVSGRKAYFLAKVDRLEKDGKISIKIDAVLPGLA